MRAGSCCKPRLLQVVDLRSEGVPQPYDMLSTRLQQHVSLEAAPVGLEIGQTSYSKQQKCEFSWTV